MFLLESIEVGCDGIATNRAFLSVRARHTGGVLCFPHRAEDGGGKNQRQGVTPAAAVIPRYDCRKCEIHRRTHYCTRDRADQPLRERRIAVVFRGRAAGDVYGSGDTQPNRVCENEWR